jgi:hypothetical protein
MRIVCYLSLHITQSRLRFKFNSWLIETWSIVVLLIIIWYANKSQTKTTMTTERRWVNCYVKKMRYDEEDEEEIKSHTQQSTLANFLKYLDRWRWSVWFVQKFYEYHSDQSLSQVHVSYVGSFLPLFEVWNYENCWLLSREQGYCEIYSN